jgi:hypothetical protein
MASILPKIIRIQDDEKELLFQLREIYGSLAVFLFEIFISYFS